MGCHLRTREEWEKGEWNNQDEFPDDGSKESMRRHNALMKAFEWLDQNKTT
jgi:hypothetical protein